MDTFVYRMEQNVSGSNGMAFEVVVVARNLHDADTMVKKMYPGYLIYLEGFTRNGANAQ